MNNKKLQSGIQYVLPSDKCNFLMLDGRNRPTTRDHINEIVSSLKYWGFCIRPVVVGRINWLTDKEDLYILDGQHLYEALKALKWDVPYMIRDVADEKTLITLLAKANSTSKRWSMADYIRAWQWFIPDYRKLKTYINKFILDISNIASILSGNGPVNGGKPSEAIKQGEFRIVDEVKNAQFLQNLQDILDMVGKTKSEGTRYTCAEYYKFYINSGSYDHKKFMKSLEKDDVQFKIALQKEGELYNIFKSIKL